MNTICMHALVLVLGVALPAWSQTPYLVKDISPGAASSDPRTIASVGDRMYFLATTPDMGYELWTSTGTEASTTPIELTPGVGWTVVNAIGTLNGSLVFGGPKVWKTDGSVAGTEVLSTAGLGAGPRGSAASTSLAVYAATSLLPMRTDGTPEGTYALAATATLQLSQLMQSITAYGSGFVFIATSELGSHQLWRTDGTRASTALVGPDGLTCDWLTAIDTRLFMSCRSTDPPFAEGLWTSDGTAEGTRLVKPVSAYAMTAVEQTLYFTIATASGGELWLSDGTTAGTRPLSAVAPIPPGLTATGLTSANGLLFFVGDAPRTGRELWRTDGTALGTFMLRDIEPGPGSALSPVDWWLHPSGYVLAAAGGGVMFVATNQATGSEAWFSDGTSAGTVPLGEIAPGPASASPSYFRQAGSRVFFGANDGVIGRELWAVDLDSGVMSVSDPVVTEGDRTTTASFIVRLAGPASAPATVWYTTAPGTAEEGSDFVARSGVLTFAPGASAQTVDVTIVGDVADETDESFTLELTALSGGLRGDRRGAAVIVDDDTPAAAVASDITVMEGDVGTTDAVFDVRLTTRDGAPSIAAAAVRFTTEDGSAFGWSDFDPTSGTLTFPAGTPSGSTLPIRVPVRGDTLDEPDTFFFVRLLMYAGNAVVSSVPGRGTILDDDGLQSARPIEVAHGSTVRASLAPPPGRTQDADYYIVRMQPYASYEAVIDEVSGDAVPIALQPYSSGGVTGPVGTGSSVSLRWPAPFATPISASRDVIFRVSSAACGSACGPEDTYRLRLYETTLRAPRANNTGGQVSIIFVQNASSSPVSGRWILWNDVGGIGGAGAFDLAPWATLVVNTASWSPGSSGSLSVMHTGRYGSLVGKVVSLDPATGFSFDTPLTYRPR